jgi:hypothetical protein
MHTGINNKKNVYYCQRELADAGMYSVKGCIGILDISAVVGVLLFVFANGIN